MPIANILIDVAARHKVLSFMDSHSGYNQIFIAKEDVHKMAFQCTWLIGVFEWIIMPFSLKNARTTYQRNTMFHEIFSQFMEVYIDDVVIKAQDFKEHLEFLSRVFQRMAVNQLKINSEKCVIEVLADHFLGFLAYQKGIEINKNKA